MITEKNVLPWMLERATDAQIDFMDEIANGLGVSYPRYPNKLDARVFLDKYKALYNEKIAQFIRNNRVNREEKHKVRNVFIDEFGSMVFRLERDM